MSRPLLIVGGGPAGMSAALAAAEHGVRSTVVDEGLDLGGQIYRKPTRPDGGAPPHRRGEQLRARVAALADRIEVRRSAAAWGVFEGRRVALSQDGASELLEPQALVLAPGALEFVPPFPSATLPGVMTPGAGQILVKTMGISPGARVVVAGSGPFLLAVACQLVAAGVHVAAVLEASPRAPWLALPLSGFRTPGLLLEGMKYLARLRLAGVPVRHSRMVIAAHGDGALREIEHAPVDADWNPDRARTVREKADALLVGFGFVPRVQLAQMAGCRLEWRPEVGGWTPVRDEHLATTVDGVWTAGDGAGVAGALVAESEGRLAGLAAAHRLGALDAVRFAALRAPLLARLRRLAPIRRALDAISLPRPGLANLVDDATIVCRCEDVAWRDVRDAVRAGCTTYRSLKVATRVGMGACQGCSCWPGVARLVAAATKGSPESAGPASPRPPVRPVTLGELAESRIAP